jgi:hypothetical protein
MLVLRDDVSENKNNPFVKHADKRRQMIYVPELNPSTFLFFFRKGESGNSWSIRDYSVPNAPTGPRYAPEFGLSLDDLWSKVRQNFDAPTHPTTDLDFWHRHTQDLNWTYLGTSPATAPVQSSAVRNAIERRQQSAYPLLDRERFERHPKARKPQDRERILSSKTSEDWVTWSAFTLLERTAPATWWQRLVMLARANNPTLTLPFGWEAKPQVRLWAAVPSPSAYEAASRERMRLSTDAAWIARSQDPRPVEGASEIDITLHNSVLAVFAEAKLGSDISLRTTYDPKRNQIIRNIDCVLDRTKNQAPMFWMIVRDISPARGYTQLVEHYLAHPDALVAELPHHPRDRVLTVARSLSFILWRDLLAQTIEISAGDDEEIIAVKNELCRRV